jgi:hypothetical protein
LGSLVSRTTISDETSRATLFRRARGPFAEPQADWPETIIVPRGRPDDGERDRLHRARIAVTD